MATKNDGGPAFPAIFQTEIAAGEQGMTLRDYFAASGPTLPDTIDVKYMEAVVGRAMPHRNDFGPRVKELHLALQAWEFEFDAKRRYAWADAMLAERAK